MYACPIVTQKTQCLPFGSCLNSTRGFQHRKELHDVVASPALWIGSMEVRYYMDTGSQLHVRSYGMQDQL